MIKCLKLIYNSIFYVGMVSDSETILSRFQVNVIVGCLSVIAVGVFVHILYNYFIKVIFLQQQQIFSLLQFIIVFCVFLLVYQISNKTVLQTELFVAAAVFYLLNFVDALYLC
eukprot:TRINITY_DN12591_c1_g1_i2.p8 TRINITY_DN12591_c1_g1~~TRINITY_DN12591_c1_g1_i2.p8  ORF type:complete len:113 (-),score=0.75 TRINITY_DN12591_c1_g1_i2:87-425(-)